MNLHFLVWLQNVDLLFNSGLHFHTGEEICAKPIKS